MMKKEESAENLSRRRITQNDVAKRAGVTRSMVSYVLNGSDRSVAPETREKILEAIDVLGYRPNKFAQGLLQGAETLAEKQIGIVMCTANMFLRPYYSEIIAGIHTAAHENNYRVQFIRFFDELKNPILFNELIHREEIGGLILLSVDQCIKTEEDKSIIKRIAERIPQIVCVEWQTKGLCSVHFNREDAAFQATAYLLSHDYRSIAYIGESDERISGFRRAFIEKGITEISGLVVDVANDMPSGRDAMEKMIASAGGDMSKLSRAVCAGSDEVAIGILNCLNAHKIAVPEQVALISIDNIEVAAYTNPPLTTINVQKRAMGTRAVELIVNHSAGKGDDAITVSLPNDIIVRSSC